MEFEVSLTIGVDADNPQEAVREFISTVMAQGFEEWCYSVKNVKTGEKEIVDMMDQFVEEEND